MLNQKGALSREKGEKKDGLYESDIRSGELWGAAHIFFSEAGF
jgi:hypothetical protein